MITILYCSFFWWHCINFSHRRELACCSVSSSDIVYVIFRAIQGQRNPSLLNFFRDHVFVSVYPCNTTHHLPFLLEGFAIWIQIFFHQCTYLSRFLFRFCFYLTVTLALNGLLNDSSTGCTEGIQPSDTFTLFSI